MITPDRRAFRRRQATSLASIALATTLVSCAVRKPPVSEQPRPAEGGTVLAKSKNVEDCANSHGTNRANVEVLSNTMGVDLGPYLNHVVDATRKRWYLLIPGAAQFPRLKKGCVAIQFRIMPDGSVENMQLARKSGDRSLDLAAWGGILDAAPFPPLPKQYKKPSLALRFFFLYNENTGQRERQ
ncbi:MAG: TonB family protein [Gemmataceae bacterium]